MVNKKYFIPKKQAIGDWKIEKLKNWKSVFPEIGLHKKIPRACNPWCQRQGG
jgi:hypothetical protein